jgi:hypothetical protein
MRAVNNVYMSEYKASECVNYTTRTHVAAEEALGKFVLDHPLDRFDPTRSPDPLALGGAMPASQPPAQQPSGGGRRGHSAPYELDRTIRTAVLGLRAIKIAPPVIGQTDSRKLWL